MVGALEICVREGEGRERRRRFSIGWLASWRALRFGNFDEEG
jgi:hypothetical protein